MLNERSFERRRESAEQAQWHGKTQERKSARSLTGTIQRSFSAQVDALKQARSIEAQAIDAEIMYLHHVEAHGISPHAAGCAGRLFQQMFPDSKIAAKMTFSDSKQGYEITHSLGPYYNDQLVSRLRCEFFSVNIDESTVLKTQILRPIFNTLLPKHVCLRGSAPHPAGGAGCRAGRTPSW